MVKPYVPVPGFYRERFTIAIMCNESMNLHWQDEHTDMSYMGKLYPQALIEENGADYVIAINDRNEQVRIRLDLIRNMPSPMK